MGYSDPLEACWYRMRNRCTSSNYPAWERYGGRGVRVCDTWVHDFNAFRQWAERHGWTPGSAIVLNDDSLEYGPDTCHIVNPNTGSGWVIPGKWKPVTRDGTTTFPSVTQAARTIISEGLATTNRVQTVACKIGEAANGKAWSAYGSRWSWN